MPPSLILIAACADNRVMGRAGRLPWHIPEDLEWFDQHTAGRTILLGRVCYESWPGAHAEGRRPIVVTSRSPEALRPRRPLPADAEGPRLARSVPDALALARTLPGDVLVCGGARIFEETLPLCDRLLLTCVHAHIDGDVFFPEWRHLAWKTVSELECASRSGLRVSFLELERVRGDEVPGRT